MISTTSQLELAKNIREISNNPLYGVDGDKLVCVAKLTLGCYFQRAAEQLEAYDRAQAELATYESYDDTGGIATYHAHMKVAYEKGLLNELIGALFLTMLLQGVVDRTTRPCGIWLICGCNW